MLVKSLDLAEEIVDSNPALEWDGWTIVYSRRNNAGWLMKNGAFKNGRWYEIRRFEPDSRGYNLPNYLDRRKR